MPLTHVIHSHNAICNHRCQWETNEHQEQDDGREEEGLQVEAKVQVDE